MKMDIVAGSQNDEFYTPEKAVIPILKYVPDDSRVWCPFDTEESIFVKMLKAKGCKVLATHIKNGHDFFSVVLDKVPCDFIISNPPYSRKTEVLERLFAAKKRFAMLVGVVGLFESQRRFDMFKNNNFETMYFNRRISYLKNYADVKPAINPPFSSIYVCSGMLPTPFVFEKLP